MASPRTIIIGAGRLGSTIARSLNKSSNVIVIDCSKEKIDRLGEYSGFVEVGDATDCSLLEKCGIKTADRVIAVTDDDNIKIHARKSLSMKGSTASVRLICLWIILRKERKR